ncbi:MAG: hypothetical protein U1E15_08165 [Hyphomicrobiales bacterium]
MPRTAFSKVWKPDWSSRRAAGALVLVELAADAGEVPVDGGEGLDGLVSFLQRG